MSKRFVYLAGPIAGCTFNQAVEWRDWVKGRLQSGIVGISPMRLKDWCKRVRVIRSMEQYAKVADEAEFRMTGESHAICARDRNDVTRADMIFVYLPKEANDRQHSWGTGHEMGWASMLQKPIVLVTDDKVLISHPLIRESVGWIVPTLEEGVDVVNSVLGAYVEEKEVK